MHQILTALELLLTNDHPKNKTKHNKKRSEKRDGLRCWVDLHVIQELSTKPSGLKSGEGVGSFMRVIFYKGGLL